jgi:ribosomal-protein-alanine N-acetyltransferase
MPNSLIITLDEECVGYVLVSEVLGEFEIEDICVANAHRGKGFATQILEYVINKSKRQGGDYILLEVAEQNKHARALYKKCGFELITVRKDYYTFANNTFDNALLLQRML